MARHAERNAAIIERRKAGETLEAIAKAYNLTRERIRQITRENRIVMMRVPGHLADRVEALVAEEAQLREASGDSARFGLDTPNLRIDNAVARAPLPTSQD